jgi:endonuclease YncB( thermonuclease family)
MIRAALLAGLVAWPGLGFAADSWRLTRVVDGDTVVMTAPDGTAVTIRVLGVDTAERMPHARCLTEATLADEATAFTMGFLAAGDIAVAIDTGEGTKGIDRYGRTLAYLRVNGRDLAQALIAAGLGRVYGGEKRKTWCPS